MTDGRSDDDWVRETLARAVLEGQSPSPTPPTRHRAAAADVGPIPPGAATAPGDDAAVWPVGAPTAEAPTQGGPHGAPPGASTGQPLAAGPTEATEPTEGDDDGPWFDAGGPDPAQEGGATAGGPDPYEHPAAVGPDDDGRSGASAVRSVVEWVVVIVGALAAALVLRALLFQAFWIPSESMEPTLQRDDRVLVNRLSYRLGDVNRGDIVVFARPPSEPEGPIQDLIKRVVALEGETVEARGGQLYVDGGQLPEPYVAEGVPIADFGPVVVPEGQVFVMGDNRNNSRDSRFFGTIEEDSIVGRAFVRFWPLDRLGLL